MNRMISGLSSGWPSDPDEHDPHWVRLSRSAGRILVPYTDHIPAGASFVVWISKSR
jgi:hypothetical protein